MNNTNQILWKISLALTSIYGPDDDLEILSSRDSFWNEVNTGITALPVEILTGLPETSSRLVKLGYEERLQKYLNDIYGIKDKRSFISVIRSFFEANKSRESFDSKRNQLLSLCAADREKFLSSIGKNRESVLYELVNSYEKTLPPAGIYAFFISNYICLCRIGLYFGYLTTEEMIDIIHEPAKEAQKHYSSFKEFGISSIVGMQYYFCEPKLNEMHQRRLLSSLTDRSSYWTNLAWKTDL